MELLKEREYRYSDNYYLLNDDTACCCNAWDKLLDDFNPLMSNFILKDDIIKEFNEKILLNIRLDDNILKYFGNIHSMEHLDLNIQQGVLNSAYSYFLPKFPENGFKRTNSFLKEKLIRCGLVYPYFNDIIVTHWKFIRGNILKILTKPFYLLLNESLKGIGLKNVEVNVIDKDGCDIINVIPENVSMEYFFVKIRDILDLFAKRFGEKERCVLLDYLWGVNLKSRGSDMIERVLKDVRMWDSRGVLEVTKN